MSIARNLFVTFLVASSLLPPQSNAATGVKRGTVEFARVLDATALPSWAPPRFWFTLTGVSSAGSCPTWGGGGVIFIAESREAYLMVLSNYLSGREIAVHYDDALLLNSFCRAFAITVGSPPPPF